MLTIQAYIIVLYLFWQAVSFLPRWGRRLWRK